MRKTYLAKPASTQRGERKVLKAEIGYASRTARYEEGFR
jgi:hypothetical protein